MNKIVNLIICLSLMGGVTVLNSCKKDKIKGCTDKDSKNYDATAEEDDASCKYEGSIVFWYNSATADSLIDDGATALTYYVDGVVVGSSAASVYWTGAPDCDQSGTVSITKDLGSVKSKTSTYSVKDDTGFEYWSGTLTFTANTCTSTKLTF
jgi:hypothetical protein